MDNKSFWSKILLYGFYFLAIYLPWQIAFNPSRTVDLASIRVVIAILFIVYLLEGRSFEKLKALANPTTVALLVFFLFLFFSLKGVSQPVWGIRKLAFLLNLALFYPVCLGALDSHQKIFRFLKLFLASALLAVLVALILFFAQFYLGIEPVRAFLADKVAFLFWGKNFGLEVVKNPSWLVAIEGKTYFRALGFFPDPHVLGFFLSFALPLALGFYLLEHKKIYLAAFLIFLLTVFLTFSRATYLGLLASLLALLVFFWRVFFWRQRLFLLGVFILTLFVFFIPFSPVAWRFYSAFSPNEGSNLSRLVLWQQAWDLFLAHPFFGVGLGNFPAVIGQTAYRQPLNIHNTYLEILTEGGILAFLGWAWLLGSTVKTLFFKVRNEANFLNFAVFGSLIWFFGSSFFEISLYSPITTALFFIYLGLAQIKFWPKKFAPPAQESYGYFG